MNYSTSQWYQDIPPYLRARLEGALELPLPIATFDEADPTTTALTSPAAAELAGVAAAVANAPSSAAAPSGGSSLWPSWLRGGGGSTSASSSNRGDSNGQGAAAGIEEPPQTPIRQRKPHHPHAGLTTTELAPAVAAMAAQELSYDTFLTLAELLV
jgi:hypothetical protein